MKVSVIIPVYNAESFIEETINSIPRSVSGIDFEIIAINDGSTDLSQYLLDKSDHPRLRVYSTLNRGESATVNLGLSKAAGTYILVMNADDPAYNFEALLTTALAILDANPKIMCTYPDWIMIDKYGQQIRKIRTLKYSQKTMYCRMKCIPGPGAIFRRDAALEIGGRNPEYRFVGDYEFWLRLSLLGPSKRIPHFLALWRFHDSSISTKYRNSDMASEHLKVIRNFHPPGNFRIWNIRYASFSSYVSAASVTLNDKNSIFRKLLWRAVLKYPEWIFTANGLRAIAILLVPRKLSNRRTSRGTHS